MRRATLRQKGPGTGRSSAARRGADGGGEGGDGEEGDGEAAAVTAARLAAGPTQQWKMQSASATAAAARGLHTARAGRRLVRRVRPASGAEARGSAPRARSAGGQRSRSEAGRREAASGAAHRRRVTSSRPRRRAAAARAARARSRRAARAEGEAAASRQQGAHEMITRRVRRSDLPYGYYTLRNRGRQWQMSRGFPLEGGEEQQCCTFCLAIFTFLSFACFLRGEDNKLTKQKQKMAACARMDFVVVAP